VDLSPIRFDAANPGPLTGPGNNTWLLDGAEPTLIDAGIGATRHVESLAAHLGGRPLVRILLTHGHPDHASGVPALRSLWPDVDVWKWPPIDDGWHVLGEGLEARAGDAMLETVHTPGHATDHVCFWHGASRSLFVGDMMAIGTTVAIPARRGGHLRSYLTSLERLAELEARRAFPGHGRIIDEPNRLIADYLEHRRLRERQVVSLLERGIREPDDLVARIYPGVPEAIRPAALETIEAHLVKIGEDGLIPPSDRPRVD